MSIAPSGSPVLPGGLTSATESGLPTVLQGTGAPSANVTNGTIYERTDSAASPLYVAESSTTATTTSYINAQISDAAVAVYPFDDVSPSLGTAIRNVGPATYGPGNYVTGGFTAGSPLILDRVSTVVNSNGNGLANLPIVPEAAANFTVEMIVKPPSGTFIFAGTSHTDVSSKGLRFSYDPTGKFQILVGYGSGFYNMITPNAYPSGVLYHLVLTYDGTTYKVYINGVLAISLAGLSPSPGTVFGFFGCTDVVQAYGYALIGPGGGLGFYTKALTNSVVASHYGNITGGGSSTFVSTWKRVSLVEDLTLASNNDIDFSTMSSGRVLAAVPSNGKAYSFITPSAVGSGGTSGSPGIASVTLSGLQATTGDDMLLDQSGTPLEEANKPSTGLVLGGLYFTLSTRKFSVWAGTSLGWIDQL